MNKVKRSWGGIALSLAVLALLLTSAAPRASADSVTTISITNPNTALSGLTSPFATVTIDCTTTTTCTVTFTADSANGYQLMDSSAADLNVNGSFAVSNYSSTTLPGGGFSSNNATFGGAGQVDGFGNFNLTTNLNDGSGSAVNTISFTITATNGNSWADAAAVVTPNNGGSTAAVHVVNCILAPCSSTVATGYAANGSQVPEPGSLTLFGSGLLSLAALLRRRLNRSRT